MRQAVAEKHMAQHGPDRIRGQRLPQPLQPLSRSVRPGMIGYENEAWLTTFQLHMLRYQVEVVVQGPFVRSLSGVHTACQRYVVQG